jgi:hydroxyacylglutathione hydrolase
VLSVKAFTFNPFQENTYVVFAENGHAIIIDPGMYHAGEDKILFDFISQQGLNVQQIILTHCHLDHVFGVYSAITKYKVPMAFHALETEVYAWATAAAMKYGLQIGLLPDADYFIKEGDKIILGDDELQILFTPGHSPGHVCLYSSASKFVIAGDTLFYDSIGRTDLPGGDFTILEQSIKNVLYVLPDDIVVYNGHGQTTTIGREKLHNSFVRA